MVAYDELIRQLAEGNEALGLVSQQASPTAALMQARLGKRLACLFSPEHGWFGLAAAGEKTVSERHPAWDIPVYSL